MLASGNNGKKYIILPKTKKKSDAISFIVIKELQKAIRNVESQCPGGNDRKYC